MNLLQAMFTVGLMVLCATPALSDEAASGDVPITVQSCKGSAFVEGRRGGARADVTYVINGTKTADAVEFLMRNDFGPRYAIAVRANGTFSPGVPIHQVLSADAPADVGPWRAYPNHCTVTYVRFTDGTELRAPGTFMAAERPEVIGEFGLPAESSPRGIAVAADGSLWVAEEHANALAHVDAGNGKVLGTFPLPTPNADPRFVARGAGGLMWFTEFKGAKVGTIAPDGTIHEYAVGCTGCHPGALAIDPSGNAWFSEMNVDTDLTTPGMRSTYGPNVIGRVTPQGVVSEFVVSSKQSYPTALFAARDGTIWFTESAGSIGHLSADGKVLVELPLTNEQPWWIGEDANGVLRTLAIDRRNPRVAYATISRTAAGGYVKLTQMAALERRAVISGGALDGKGDLWFTDMLGNRVVRVTARGRAEELNLGIGGTYGAMPTSIAVGDDGTLWVVEVMTNRIVHIRPH